VHDQGTGGAESLNQPWERIVAASLGADAAGRIEWRRIMLVSVLRWGIQPGYPALVAPPAWERALRPHYGPQDGADAFSGVLHVIGRATDTSAGPAMEVASDGSATEGRATGGRLLGVSELKRNGPAVVILQAEPASTATIGAVTDPGPPSDQVEKLRLGAAIAQDGVLAVFLFPVLPAAIASELAEIISAHAKATGKTPDPKTLNIKLTRRGVDAEALLTRLRAAIAPHVPPQVLDDVVLFLNAHEVDEGELPDGDAAGP
jgi:hypothetical protein